MATITERYGLIITESGALVVGERIRGIGTQANRARRDVGNLSGALRALATGVVIRELAQLNDTYIGIRNRTRLVTQTTGQLDNTMDALRQTAVETRASLEGTGQIFNRIALQADRLNLSNRDTIDIVRTINQAVSLSGLSAREANQGLIQLSQGIAAGALRGDELRAVLEQLPPIARIIAEEMGVSVGELRKFGKEGDITSERIIKAFRDAEDEVAQAFATSVPTIGQAFNVLNTELTFFIGQAGEASGAAEGLARSIITIAEALPRIAGGIGDLAIAAGQELKFDLQILKATLEGDFRTAALLQRAKEAFREAGSGFDTGDRLGQTDPDLGGGEGTGTPIVRQLTDVQKFILALERRNRLAAAFTEQQKTEVQVVNALQKLRERGLEVSAEEEGIIRGLIESTDAYEARADLYKRLVPDVQALNVELENVARLQRAGLISDRQAEEEEARIRRLIEPLTDLEQFTRETYQGLVDSIVESFARGENAVKQFVASAVLELAKLTAQEALFAGIPGLSTSRIFGRQFGGPFAAGDRVLVGEGGRPEIVTFGQGGRVDPLPQQAATPNFTLVQVRDENEAIAAINSAGGQESVIGIIGENRERVRTQLGLESF